MLDAAEFVPRRLNSGRWLAGYSLSVLRERIRHTTPILPLCRIGTPAAQVTGLGELILPPLYVDAMSSDLRNQVVSRIGECFPWHTLSEARRTEGGAFRVVEVPEGDCVPMSPRVPSVVAFSVDTAVEQHGPHLPLATDTIQSYAVLGRLASEFPDLVVLPPLDYGHLTWGLPFGLSVDITPALLTEYVAGFVNLVVDRCQPSAVFVVDVHGSIVHRAAIESGLKASRAERHKFRWLHEPLVEFAGDRGDQHAGGVETALIESISTDLIDPRWFPSRIDELAAGQLTVSEAAALSADLPRFIREVEGRPLNGIVGEIRNYRHVDARLMMDRMLAIGRRDVAALLDSGTQLQS